MASTESPYFADFLRKSQKESCPDPLLSGWDALISFVIRYQPWLWSISASVVIGLSGVLPILIIPVEAGSKLKQEGASKTLRLLLSFAVGGLLGDVFLHLLPEAWQHMCSENQSGGHITTGLWVLAGVFTFIVIEMMCEKTQEEKTAEEDTPTTCGPPTKVVGLVLEKSAVTNGVGYCAKVVTTNGRKCGGESTVTRNGHSYLSNGNRKHAKNEHSMNGHSNGHAVGYLSAPHLFAPQSSQERNSQNGYCQKIKCSEGRNITGYLNLLANSIDNFTHGLAVAGSFLVSSKVGILTTFAILIHEIPHEIGDFAILLKSGFSRLDAAKAQMATATIGLAGAVAALTAESAQTLGDRTAWILPFTAGGFLNIALVNVLPDIIQEKDPKESVKQMGCLLAGIAVMALVTLLFG